MAESIIDGSGAGYKAKVDSSNRLHVDSQISGVPLVEISGGIHIGSVSANVDSIYIQSGANIVGSLYPLEVSPTDVTKNNPAWKFEYQTSGTATGTTGSRIGSIIMFIDAGSYVNTLTYANDRITNVGSWS